MTARQMVNAVLKTAKDWQYDVVSIGFPGPVIHGRPLAEPRNLGGGWMGFNFTAAFKHPVKLINDASMQALPPEYRYEPALALIAGDDGLGVVRRILQQARRHLTRHGILLVEVGDGRATLEVAYPELEFTWLEAGAADASVFLLERGQLPD